MLCRFAGQLVAVRLAFSDQAQCAAQLEVAVYEQIQELQGCCVPCLVAHGYTCGGSAYFAATTYIKVLEGLHSRSAKLELNWKLSESQCKRFSSSMFAMCLCLLALPSSARVLMLQASSMLAIAQGSAWNWRSPLHQSLKGELQAVVERLHEAGVVHGDLNMHNIKVTSDNKVYVPDFEKAALPTTSPEFAAELRHELTRLDYVVSTKVGKLTGFPS